MLKFLMTTEGLQYCIEAPLDPGDLKSDISYTNGQDVYKTIISSGLYVCEI
jgi:hypothetical protein